MPGGQHAAILAHWKSWGGHSYIGSRDPDLVPSMFNGVHVWTPGWRIHDLHILFCQKIGHVTCCLGRGIVLHKNSRRPGKLSMTEKPDEANWWLRVPPSTTSSLLPSCSMAPMAEGPWLPSMGRMHASIIFDLACGAHEHGNHCKTV